MKQLDVIKRVVLILIGMIFLAIGASMLVSTGIGGDAVVVFQQGFARITGLKFGDAVLVLNIILLVILYLLDKKKISIGTVIVVLLPGPIINFLFKLNIYPEVTNNLQAIILTLIASFFATFGIALYIYANLGLAPFEGLVIIAHERTKIQFRYLKIINDILLFFFGWLLGGNFGIGSIITIFLFGPLIDFFLTILKRTKFA